MPKIKYMQLEPSAYTSDPDWLVMTGIERGCYHSLIIWLSCNDGMLTDDAEFLRKLCNVRLKVFKSFWKKYANRFPVSGGYISHRRVTRELVKARKNRKQKSLAGKASANARSTAVQQPFNGRTPARSTNVTKRNRSELKVNSNSNTVKNSSALTNSLRFIVELEKIIIPRTRSDKTAFRNLTKWAELEVMEGKKDVEIYGRILGYARESVNANNPAAAFFSTLDRELNYKPKRGVK